MHLLDMPKPIRRRRPRCACLSYIASFCLYGLLVWSHHSQPKEVVCGYAEAPFASAPEPEPVKYVTVKTTGYGIPCDVTISPTHQMPLMEVYEALRQVEDVAETEVETMPIEGRMSNAFIEQVYLRHEKEFMREYGLTEKQVAMIKREGRRMTHPKPLMSDE